MAVGLDIGTSFIVASRFDEGGKVQYREIRDAFLAMKPKTAINRKMIEGGLQRRKAVYLEQDGTLFVVGQDAIEMANERNEVARRPMSRGVVNPNEQEALPILKFILKEIVGSPTGETENLCYCVPANPVDANFDMGYHQDVLNNYLNSLGYKVSVINEAEAIGYSQLLDDGLTGITLSFGAGMVNTAVLSAGDPVVKFSTARSGDWIDEMAGQASGNTPTIVQSEKEGDGGVDLLNPKNPIQEAITIYYKRLIAYVLENIALSLRDSDKLPSFKEPIPIVIAGGTSQAKNFLKVFEEELSKIDFPVKVKEVRHAKDPLHAVSEGCLLAAQAAE